MHGVAAGKDADEVAIAFRHENSADVALAHGLASRSYRRGRWQDNGVLVPHNIGHLSHDQALLLVKAVRGPWRRRCRRNLQGLGSI